MGTKDKMTDVRDEYIDLIKSELLGPGSEYSIPDPEHELITNNPEVRYSVGILFPQENKIQAESDESMRKEDVESGSEEVEEEMELSDNKPENTVEQKTWKTKGMVDAEENNLDEEIGLAAQNLPSSMGVTFFLCGGTDKIVCNVSFATYRKAIVSDCKVPFLPDNPQSYIVPNQLSHFMKYDSEISCLSLISSVQKKEIWHLFETDSVSENEADIFNSAYRLCDQLRMGFVREPHEVKVELHFENTDYIDNNKEIDGTTVKITALRRKIGKDMFSVTVMMVNNCFERPNGRNCILQPKIMISTDENSFSFCEYGSISNFSKMDEEEQSLALLYRKKKIFGTGLGTSIGWVIDENGKGKIYNDFFPEIEVPAMDFELSDNSGVSRYAMSMKHLSDLNNETKEDKVEVLKSVVKSYEKWINDLYSTAKNLKSCYQPQAHKNIEDCKIACQRMAEGIVILNSNENAWNSFLLANRAMFMQRQHIRMQGAMSKKDRYPYDDELAETLKNMNYEKAEDNHFWRPFQLAFILMSVKSMTSDDNADRDIVDLIWFPTGGGKTEAYLGLTAFTIFYRRLAYSDQSEGTAVIMRYTLRLLAAQQFTRAATLICACEFIRQDCMMKRPKYQNYCLGGKAITIGLWIGREHTPNKNANAKDLLDKLLAANESNIRDLKERNNKFQVLKCPWCGTKLVRDKVNNKLTGQWGYRMRNNKHFEMSCPQEKCAFNQKLPIQIIDQELYLNPPTLLFGTVDKFAMLPWENSVGAFFATDSDNRAPELIIQDELHLISGPLGTMVGLYETAIDALCRAKGANPKIVASTATIRRAKEQCSVLYNREVLQFPSPGLDAEDSYFAKESQVNYVAGKFGRKYIGLLPAGKTKAMMEVRTIAALLQKAKSMDLTDELRDKIWTLTVYFNSLKDLGKCRTLIDDDVKDFIKRMSYRLGTARDGRIILGADELTSRVSTTELNETLDKLEKLEYSKENINNNRYASNALLATNMISVGIDVARLNVMLLVGQPKLTSEYIQASSRVGRSYPGVAFTLYDGSKSRDRSHYEQFKAYHESFYKFVEPTGATPFSKPARERALHAVAATMMRHRSGLSEDNNAGMFDKEYFEDIIQSIEDYIVDRVKDIVDRADLGLADESDVIRAELNEFFDLWDRLAKNYGQENLYFGKRFISNNPSALQGRLFKIFGTAEYDSMAKDTLTSMRNVDSSIAGDVLIWED